MFNDIDMLDSSTVLLNDTFMVQRACLDDLPTILAIYNQSIAGKQATANLVPVTIEERAAWFNEHLDNPKRPIYVVKVIASVASFISADKTQLANNSGRIIAWGSFSDLYTRTAYHISSEISIYLHQDYHGQGLGSLLIRWMMTQAQTLGIKNVVALIFAHNEPSLKLFQKLGFEQWGYMPQVCDMQGFIADVVMLGRVTS